MSNLITLTDPRSPAAEAYQSLRTNLEFARLEQPLHTLLITSVDAETEKNIALANLAVVMAQAGDSVIVVDGDLRRPQLHELFGASNQSGLTTWLTDGVSLERPAPLQRTAVDGVHLLAAGPATAHPTAVLSTRHLADALAQLRTQANYVLCGAPPVLAVTDAALWASQVDGVVLLVNAGGTRRDHAQRAKSILDQVRARIVGAVLLNADKDAVLSGYQAA
ncbi:MAG TPA: CpsD/CapB family tyrosine-protein kinase [Caldilineaceae bacterium]|nr:CpsD/CapB family tyrosine-protein kinase [Caldilineaceae bacterium]